MNKKQSKRRKSLPTYSAEEIADYFVFLASQQVIDESGAVEGITPLKLQKMLYFTQAAALSVYGKEIIKEDFQAWKYGPVVPVIYRKFKDKQNQPIQCCEGTYKNIKDKETKRFLQGAWELFGKYSAVELVAMSHSHSPWKSRYKEGKNNVIPKSEMKDYYKNIFRFDAK